MAMCKQQSFGNLQCNICVQSMHGMLYRDACPGLLFLHVLTICFMFVTKAFKRCALSTLL